MDQKVTEEKMLALTEGKADGSRGNSSYVMLPSDRKAVAETRSSASGSEYEITQAKIAFGNKGRFGLWWDAKGIFNSSDEEAVAKHMEKHRKFYEAVVTFTVMVEKGDRESYNKLLDLLDELAIMEEQATRDAASNKSKAICRMVRKFLNEKYKLDHNLKRVECVIWKQKIDDFEKSNERSREAVVEIGQAMEKLLEENREIKRGLRQSQDQTAKLHAENQVCKSLVERLVTEKEELRETMAKIMEEHQLEADRRAEEANRRSEARDQRMAEQTQRELQTMAEQNQRELQKMAEQNQRELQKITQMLMASLSLKNHNITESAKSE